MRSFLAPAVLATALVLGGCGSDGPAPAAVETPSPESSSPPSPGPALPEPSAGSPSRPGSATVPHEDDGVGRTGEVATRRATCVMDGTPDFSFDGTVTRVEDGQVTFTVAEVFSDGDLPATYTVEMGAPVTGRASESSPSYGVGTRMLVQGADGTAWGCGATVYYEADVAAERRS